MVLIVIFFTPIGQGARVAIDNKVNPITKQCKILGAATKNLEKIKEMATSGSLGKIESAKLEELNSLIADTESNIDEVKALADKGDAVAAIGGLISSVIPDKAGPSCTPQ